MILLTKDFPPPAMTPSANREEGYNRGRKSVIESPVFSRKSSRRREIDAVPQSPAKQARLSELNDDISGCNQQ